jgi:hypothetical protein
MTTLLHWFDGTKNSFYVLSSELLKPYRNVKDKYLNDDEEITDHQGNLIEHLAFMLGEEPCRMEKMPTLQEWLALGRTNANPAFSTEIAASVEGIAVAEYSIRNEKLELELDQKLRAKPPWAKFKIDPSKKIGKYIGEIFCVGWY